jgi:hypothetical protein
VFDLTAAHEVLDEAQTSFEAGDVEAAFALLNDAQDEIDRIQAECQVIPELVETSVGGMLTFGVPQDWAASAEDEDGSDGSLSYITASDPVALEASMGSTPSLVENQQVVGVLYAAGDEIGSMTDIEGGEVTLDLVVQGLIASLDDETDALLSEPETLTVKDWRAQNFRLKLDGAEATAYVVEVERGEAYVIMIGIGASGRLDAADAVIRAMVDTLDYNAPVASTAPGSGASAEPTATAP